jgi:hypothetical protein
VTGIQPASTGTVVVVVVGAVVGKGLGLVEEMEDPRLALASEQEASSNEVSIDRITAVRAVQPTFTFFIPSTVLHFPAL